jgi:hypothetical protein
MNIELGCIHEITTIKFCEQNHSHHSCFQNVRKQGSQFVYITARDNSASQKNFTITDEVSTSRSKVTITSILAKQPGSMYISTTENGHGTITCTCSIGTLRATDNHSVNGSEMTVQVRLPRVSRVGAVVATETLASLQVELVNFDVTTDEVSAGVGVSAVHAEEKPSSLVGVADEDARLVKHDRKLKDDNRVSVTLHRSTKENVRKELVKQGFLDAPR